MRCITMFVEIIDNKGYVKGINNVIIACIAGFIWTKVMVVESKLTAGANSIGGLELSTKNNPFTGSSDKVVST